jgi:hypothetical protein
MRSVSYSRGMVNPEEERNPQGADFQSDTVANNLSLLQISGGAKYG